MFCVCVVLSVVAVALSAGWYHEAGETDRQRNRFYEADQERRFFRRERDAAQTKLSAEQKHSAELQATLDAIRRAIEGE